MTTPENDGQPAVKTDLLPEKPTLADRVFAYLQDVLPKWLILLFKHKLVRFAAAIVVVYISIILLPLLPPAALNLASHVIPDAKAKFLKDAYFSIVLDSYTLKDEATALNNKATSLKNLIDDSNKTLDYVMHVEFDIGKTDAPKSIPTKVRYGQRASIVIRRAQLVPIGDCPLPASGPILRVSLDELELKQLSNMSQPGAQGGIHLSRSWWAAHLKELQSKGGDGSGTVEFGISPALNMPPCAVLRTEAIIEAYKTDLENP